MGRGVQAPSGATRVSLAGKTVMPMFVDVHGHAGFMKDGVLAASHYGAPNIIDQLNRLEYYGVGAFLSLGTDLGLDAWNVRRDQRAGKIGGARLLVAGRGFVAPGGGPTISPMQHSPYEVDQPEFARLLVRELAAQQADMVKVWVDDRSGTRPKLPPEIYRAVIDEAHVRGLKVQAHVYYLADAKELLRAGVDGFAHMVRDVEVDDEFVRMARERNIFQATAMSTQAKPLNSGWLADSAFTDTMPAAVLERLKADAGSSSPAVAARNEQFRSRMRSSIGKMRAAGIRFVLGSDTGIPSRFFGYNEHLELQAMVDAGLTPLEAIGAATRVSAEVVGLTDLGTLTAGKSADFVVLDANPLEDIRNTLTIVDVYRRGRAIDRARLREAWQQTSDSR
jgi:imidazolonepropionase-like amidohydrolase